MSSSRFYVEIVLAHYNGSAYIEQQLDSIHLSAKRANINYRIFIIDDSSRSEEYNALEKIVSDMPEVQLIRNQMNLGVIKTFAKGLEMTMADYVMLSDQDDVWMTDKIQKSLTLIKQIEDRSPALVFTDLTPVNHKLFPIRESMLNLHTFYQDRDRYGLLLRNLVAGCTVMVNRRLLEIALPIPTDITMHDHWLAVCAAFGGKIAYLNEPTLLYRQHGGNVVGNAKGLMSRLRKPFHSLRRLNRSLSDKNRQVRALIERLGHFQLCVNKTDLDLICKSLESRSLKGLLILRRFGALKTFGNSQIVLWPAILLTSIFRPRGMQ
jgi:glycosyltransferase involved in cell wall biosynthesis